MILSNERLQINDRVDTTPITITPAFMNDTYYSDVTVRLTSSNFSGSFQIQPLPGRVRY